MLDQIFAHAHQRPGAARREIETAEQLLAGRLHRPQERLKAARVRSLIVASPSGAKLLLVGVEVMRKKAKEVETLFHSKAGVEVEDLAGERHPRCFPAARQQIPAEGLEVLRRLCCLGCAPTSIRSGAGGRALNEGATAVSDAASISWKKLVLIFRLTLKQIGRTARTAGPNAFDVLGSRIHCVQAPSQDSGLYSACARM